MVSGDYFKEPFRIIKEFVPDTEYTPDVLLTCENYESEEKMTDNIDYENGDFKAFIRFMARMIEKYGPLEEDAVVEPSDSSDISPIDNPIT